MSLSPVAVAVIMSMSTEQMRSLLIAISAVPRIVADDAEPNFPADSDELGLIVSLLRNEGVLS